LRQMMTPYGATTGTSTATSGVTSSTVADIQPLWPSLRRTMYQLARCPSSTTSVFAGNTVMTWNDVPGPRRTFASTRTRPRNGLTVGIGVADGPNTMITGLRTGSGVMGVTVGRRGMVGNGVGVGGRAAARSIQPASASKHPNHNQQLTRKSIRGFIGVLTISLCRTCIIAGSTLPCMWSFDLNQDSDAQVVFC